ncbi:MAG: pantetheine-phosphate adenylyltransferase [Planctomycetes bacterium]|nr:pantetheine-phosphate adenylyltransferase [Planctomycetota bacterium]
MPNSRQRIAVFPGTFDPPTLGHLGIIERARRLFDRTIVAVGVNPEKSPLFTARERVEMLREELGDAPDVEIEAYTGLTMDYVKNKGADVLVKGIRDSDDLRNELRQANVNMIAGDVETVFLFTDDQTALISGSLIRQIAEMGGLSSGKLERLIPLSVVNRLRKKLES